MRKLIAILLIVAVGVPIWVNAAKPDKPPEEPKKVFVCKYVGKPGEDERLQTGQNPINVSVNSIKDYQGVGSYFNDAQGRSYVLAEDVGQPEPDASECPKPDVPEDCQYPDRPKNQDGTCDNTDPCDPETLNVPGLWGKCRDEEEVVETPAETPVEVPVGTSLK